MNKKTPPHSHEVEQSVIGAMLIDARCVPDAIEVLKGNISVFYDIKHQYIYEAIYDIYANDSQVDLLTVSQQLKKQGKLSEIGSEKYLIELTQKISSGAHIEYHCRILQQDYIKRESIFVGQELAQKSFQDSTDCFDLLDSAYAELDKVTDYVQRKKEKSFSDISKEFIESLDSEDVTIPSGIEEVNQHANGYTPTNLFILAARPGMGKTAYVLSEAKAQAERGYPVGIFSMEMSDKELTGRIYSNACSVDSQNIANRSLNTNQRTKVLQKREHIESLPIYINDTSGMTFMEVKVQAKKWVREKGVKIIYLDYIQLMEGTDKKANREQNISQISRNLKGLAKTLEVPVIALSQLSRNVEQRGGTKRPILSDLRESGAIEQDADVVAFLYRPEYYNLDNFDDLEETPSENRSEIYFAKFRNGNTGSKIVGCNLRYMRYFGLDELQ